MSDRPLDRLSEAQRLLLSSVLRTDDRATTDFGRWRELVDLDDVDHESQRLLPLLARRFGDLAPDDPLRDRVRGIYRYAWVKNHLLVRDAASLATTLQGLGMRVMVLKGGALVRAYGGDWGMRPMYDLDLCVPFDRAGDAIDALFAHGWRAEDGASATWVRTRVVPRRHSFPFERDIEGGLDLHWHVLATSLGRHDDDDFWQAAVPVSIGDVDVVGLCDADLLLHVIAHGARERDSGAVQWIADATQVIRATGIKDLPDRLAAVAARHDLASTLHAGLDALVELTGEPLVRDLLGALPRRTSRAQTLVHRARGLRASLANAVDAGFASRPVAYGAYLAAGRPTSLAATLRRAGGLARTAVGPAGRYELGTVLDLADAAVADRFAGPGWWDLDGDGIRSHGAECRLVLDLGDGAPDGGDLQLELTLRATRARGHAIEVRVNETAVGTVDVTAEQTVARVVVPAAAAARFRPVEIAFDALRHPDGRRRVDLCLRSVRLSRRAVDR